jgi:hypothetical protein
MLFNVPAVITTLEEDFKKIGLLTESDSNTEPSVDLVDSTETEATEIEEARRIRRRTVAGARKMMATKRTTASQRLKGKKMYRRKKMKIKLARKKKMRSSKFRRRVKFLAKRAAARREGVESISTLAETLRGSLESATPVETMKSFAEMALIADLLANRFEEMSSDLAEDQLDEAEELILANFEAAALSLTDLAEAAAEVATSMKNEEEPEDAQDLVAAYNEYLEDILGALDLYNEACGEDEDDDEDEDEDEASDDEAEESKSGK